MDANAATTYLKFANLQMAAEALYPIGFTSGPIPLTTLTSGNNRASRFPSLPAAQFAGEWEVLSHKSDTSTGFSGTLFRSLSNGELVLSFRSTEFIDDAVRDSQATNAMEISAFGWAFGQIADMKEWFDKLNQDSTKLKDKNFSVTGYSLGGHLATALNLMLKESGELNRISQTYTFNGAGVGETKNGVELTPIIASFQSMRSPDADLGSEFSDPNVHGIYENLRVQLRDGALVDTAQLDALNRLIANTAETDIVRLREAQLLLDALLRIVEIQAEAKRIGDPPFASGAEGALPLQPVPARLVAATDLNYQLAVLIAARSTGTSALLSLGRTLGPFRFPNFYDVYGDTWPSAVANSQLHYGQATPVFIEDQPLWRGTELKDIIVNSLAARDLKLLNNNFVPNDFGDTHSLVLLVDSLAVQSVLAKLDPTVALQTLSAIAGMASESRAQKGGGGDNQGRAEGDSLERVIDAINKLVNGPLAGTIDASTQLTGGTWANAQYRNGFYDALEAIQAPTSAFGALASKVTVQVSSSLDLGELARNQFSAMAALISLAPLVVLPFDFASQASVDATLKERWGDAYAAWEHDRLLSDSAADDGLQEFSNHWLVDRAELLDWLLYRNRLNIDGVQSPVSARQGRPIPDAVQYVDKDYAYPNSQAGLTLLVGPRGPEDARRQVFFGGSGADSIAGFRYSDHLYGGAGNDTVTGLAGGDYLEGNAGADQLDGGTGNDTLLGGADADRLFGGDNNDSLLGGDGDDNLQGEKDADTLRGGSGNDILDGGTGNDVLYGGDDIDVLQGAEGDDTLYGGAGRDGYFMDAGWGHDVIEDSDGVGSISVGGYGTLSGEGARKIADGVWTSADGRVKYTVVPLGGGVSTLDIAFYANAGDAKAIVDSLRVNRWSSGDLGITLGGTVSAPVTDRTLAGDFAKQLSPGGAYVTTPDHNYASAGPVASSDDVITGAFNAGDRLVGLNGNDALAGLDGNDDLEGGDGDDLLVGGPGQDTLQGGAGRDFIYGSGQGGLALPTDPAAPPPLADGIELTRGFSWVTWRNTEPDANGFQTYDVRGADVTTLFDDGNLIDGGDGDDRIVGATGADTVHGGDGNDSITGSAGEDTLFGDEGDDVLEGDGVVAPGYVETVLAADQSDDLLVGGGGRDTLTGDGGNDELYGGNDDDKLFGDADSAKVTPFEFHGSDTLDGGTGNDELTGGGNADDLFGGTGNDLLLGDDSLDKLDGRWHGDDYLDGEEGDDILEGGGGTDTLYGGDGNDMLWGDAAASGLQSDQYGFDALDGEEGNDTLVGGGNADTLIGGDGDDQLIGDALGDEVAAADQVGDLLDGGAGNDSLWGGGGADTLDGGDGDDFLIGDGDKVLAANEGTDLLDGGAGNDTLQGNGGDDFLDGGEGNDFLDGGKGSDYVGGGSGADTVLGDAGDDYLDGQAGDDQLVGGSGNDTLVGGPGADYLAGGAGDDTYLVFAGDAERNDAGFRDTIDDGEGSNLVAFDAGAPQRVVSSRGSSDFVVVLATGEEIGVVDGAARSETHYRFGGAAPVSLMPSTAVAESDTADSGESADATSTYTVGELIGTFSDDGASGVDGDGHAHVLGGRNADTLDASGGHATISGGRGDDTITAAGGDDTFLFSRGDGHDLVTESGATQARVEPAQAAPATAATMAASSSKASAGEWAARSTLVSPQWAYKRQLLGTWDGDTDAGDDAAPAAAAAAIPAAASPPTADDTEARSRVVFGAGIAPSDIRLGGAAGGLTLSIDGVEGDAITFGAFDQTAAGARPAIDTFVFADGTTLAYADLIARGFDGGAGDDVIAATAGADRVDGHGGNDQLFGGDGDDTLIGGVGDDILSGGSGSDRYVFAVGDGRDVIDNGDAASALTDVLALTEVATSDVTLSASGADLLVEVGTAGDRITVVDYFLGTAIGRIEFAGGVAWGASEIAAHVSRPLTEGADSVVGTQGDDVIDALGGDDTVSALEGDDRVDGGAGNDRLLGGPGNDTLLGGVGNDVLDGSDGDDRLDGGSGVDTLVGGAGDNVLIDGETMSAGTGADTYVLNSLSGVVQVDDAGGRADWLVLPANMSAAAARVDVGVNSGIGSVDYLDLEVGGGIVLLSHYFNSIDGPERIEQIRFGDGTVWSVADVLAHLPVNNVSDGDDRITGFRWNDVIRTLGGNDIVNGAAGDDFVDGGAGNDTLSGSVGNDTLDGGVGRDLVQGESGSDSVAGGEGDDTLYGDASQFFGAGSGDGADLLDGGAGDDRLFGGGGGDTLLGGAGNDELSGDSGDDAYLLGRGSGRDRIVDTAGNDRTVFDADVAPVDVTLSRDGSDLLLAIGQTQAQVRFASWFEFSSWQVERFEFAGGVFWDAATIAARTLVGSPNAMTGTAGDDVFVVDDARDTIAEAANAGTDTVLSSVSYTLPDNVERLTLTGNFDLNATGNGLPNVLVGNAGNNVLTAVGADDTLIGGAGDDTYVDGVHIVEAPGAGNDLLVTSGYGIFQLPDNVENIAAKPLASSFGATYLGNASANVITGSVNSNYWDIYDGKAGADTMVALNDHGVFYVDDPGDVIVSASARVFSTIDYTLAPGHSDLTLIGNAATEGTGNAGRNVLNASLDPAHNTLVGAAGDDTLIGGSDDVLDGGEGDDWLQGLGDNNVFVFGVGDGHDTVVENGGTTALHGNVLRFDPGIGTGDVAVGREGSDLTLTLSASGDQVRVDGFFRFENPSGAANPLQRVEFADGTSWGLGELRAKANPGLVNTSPVLVQPIPDAQRARGSDVALFIPSQIFSDPDPGDALTFSASMANGDPLPSWLSFDPAARRFDGTASVSGVFSVRVTATDYGGLSVSDVFDLVVNEDKLLVGTTFSDTLVGGLGNDTLNGLGGDDVLDGREGDDSMVGGIGNDRYYVDRAGDIVVELSAQGTDAIYSSVSLMLPENVEDLYLVGTGALSGTGNFGANHIEGTSGANRIDGGFGADSMTGGEGDDTFVVDNPGDVIYEYANGGIDTVESSVTWTLFDNIENLTLTGNTLFVNGTGNLFDNVLIGNAQGNQLDGSWGNDTLDGGGGDDQLTGGGGDNVYLFGRGSGNDRITGAIADPVTARLSTLQFKPGVAPEDIVVRTAMDFGRNSNVALELTIAGTNDRVTIDGFFYLDSPSNAYNPVQQVRFADGTVWDLVTLESMAAAFTPFSAPPVVGSSAPDLLVGTGFAERLSGLAGNDTLQGAGGADWLDGGSGNDVMSGGPGDDVYIVDSTADVVDDQFPDGIDVVRSSVTWTLGAWTENLVLTGNGAINGTGNDSVNRLFGNAADNVLDGGRSSDLLVGGAGNDTYLVENAGDEVFEAAGEGVDVVLTSISYALAANVEELTLTGTAAINATGNALGNVLRGNSAKNTLAGGAGDDTLIGNGGGDVFDGGGGDDVLVAQGDGNTYLFGGGDGHDTISAVLGSGAAENNVLRFKPGVSRSDVTVTRAGMDLHLDLAGSGGRVILASFVDAERSASGVQRVEFSDGSAWDRNELIGLALASDHAPTVSQALSDQSVLRGSPLDFVVPAASFTDLDPGDALRYSATLANGDPLPGWLLFDPASRRFSGATAAVDPGAYDIRVTATDLQGLAASDVFELTIRPSTGTGNHPPRIGVPLLDLETPEDSPFTFFVPETAFSDADSDDVLTLSARLANGAPLPAWLTFDAAARAFSGTPANGDVGQWSISVLATDKSGSSAASVFDLEVLNTNDAPTAHNDVLGVTENAVTDDLVALLLGNDDDPDSNDSLSITSVQRGDSSGAVRFDRATQTLTYAADAAVFDALGAGATRVDTFSYTIADAAGATSTAMVAVTVTGVNDAPTVAETVLAQSATAGETFTFTPPASTFVDVDAGDTLAYSASLTSGAPLPAWLHFDAATRTFSGTPHGSDVGVVQVSLIATDTADASVSVDFSLTVGKGDVIPVLPPTQLPIVENATSADLAPALLAVAAEAGVVLGSIAAVDTAATIGEVRFDRAAQTLTYAANGTVIDALPAGATLSDSFAYTLVDAAGEHVTSTVAMTVTGIDDAPIVAAALADQEVAAGMALDFQLAAGAFTDRDAGDRLRYAATLADGSGLPGWIAFDAVSRSFSGDAPNVNVSLDIQVTATDLSGAMASDVFSLRTTGASLPIGDDDGWLPRGLRKASGVSFSEDAVGAMPLDLASQASSLVEAMAAFASAGSGSLATPPPHQMHALPTIASPWSA